MPEPANRADRIIDPSLLYDLRTFRRLAGLGDFAMRKARRQGLKVLAWDKKQYVLGSDWVKFLQDRQNQKPER